MYNIPDRPEYLSADWILLKVSQEDIFERVCGIKPVMKEAFRNPLRPEDKKPGCKFFVRSGYLWFKDFSEGSTYNCFTFLMAKESISYPAALDWVYDNMIKNNYWIVNSKPFFTEAEETVYSNIEVTVQPFTPQDIEYLKGYYLTSDLCTKYKVYSIKNYWINGDLKYGYNQYNPCLGYYFGNGIWKLYFYKNKNRRFLTNAPFSHLQGWDQKRPADKMFITKSLKDVMCYDVIDLTAVAPHGETIAEWVNEIPILLDTYPEVYINMDNDKAGIKTTNKLLELYPSLLSFYFPEEFKDASGFMKVKGPSQTLNYIKAQCQQKRL